MLTYLLFYLIPKNDQNVCSFFTSNLLLLERKYNEDDFLLPYLPFFVENEAKLIHSMDKMMTSCYKIKLVANSFNVYMVTPANLCTLDGDAC